MSKTSRLFKCKTGEAYQIKILSELLANNLRTGCLNLTESGIQLRMFDHHKVTMVDLVLDSENFSMYKFKYKDTHCIGLNLSHFHKVLKSIKKKDSLELFIAHNAQTELGIKNIPKENTRITTSSIKIQNLQNIESELPTGYGKPVIVPSSDFQKMCKELSSIGSTDIHVEAGAFHIKFIGDADGILTRQVRLGDTDDATDDESDSEEYSSKYSATFTTDQLSRISKIAGLHTTMQIFPGNNELPLLFRSNVGSLGKISIYIKSKEMLEMEARQDESDDSDQEE
jgi:proliferating cell nuclear antigen PCNA